MHCGFEQLHLHEIDTREIPEGISDHLPGVYIFRGAQVPENQIFVDPLEQFNYHEDNNL